MTKVVIMNQIHMNNIPRDIAFSTPSASVSLHSTDVSYKSNYTKRSTLSSQSLEIINKVKYYLQISNQVLKDIETSKYNNNNTKQSIGLHIPIAQPVNNTSHSVATIPITKTDSNPGLNTNYNNTASSQQAYNNISPNHFNLTQLATTITSTPVLKLPTFNANNSKSFLLSVITQIQSTPFYKPLINTNNPPFIFNLKALQFPAIIYSL